MVRFQTNDTNSAQVKRSIPTFLYLFLLTATLVGCGKAEKPQPKYTDRFYGEIETGQIYIPVSTVYKLPNSNQYYVILKKENEDLPKCYELDQEPPSQKFAALESNGKKILQPIGDTPSTIETPKQNLVRQLTAATEYINFTSKYTHLPKYQLSVDAGKSAKFTSGQLQVDYYGVDLDEQSTTVVINSLNQINNQGQSVTVPLTLHPESQEKFYGETDLMPYGIPASIVFLSADKNSGEACLYWNDEK